MSLQNLLQLSTLRLLCCLILPALLTSILGISTSISDDVVNPKQKTDVGIQTLLQQLSDRQFELRESATRQLIAAGPTAVEEVQKYQTQSTSLEVKARCISIIKTIQQSSLPERFNAFMRRPDDVETHKFYGWTDFAKIVGTTRAARRVFLDLNDQYPWLCSQQLITPESIDGYASEALEAIRGKMQLMRDTTVSDCVALQYLMLRMEGRATGDIELIALRLIHTYPYSTHLNAMQAEKSLKQLTGQWLLSIKSDLLRPLLISLDFKLPEGRELADKILRDQQLAPQTYMLAMQAMVVFGTEAELPIIEKWLDDDKLVTQFGPEATQRYCDLALAAAVTIRKLNIRDYFPNVIEHSLRGYLPSTLYFNHNGPTDLRAEALQRYREAVAVK